jgi:hypothetical protein
MDIKDFAKKVADMRMAQNAFFRAKKDSASNAYMPGITLKADHWLRISKELEREVDSLCKQITAKPDLFSGD